MIKGTVESADVNSAHIPVYVLGSLEVQEYAVQKHAQIVISVDPGVFYSKRDEYIKDGGIGEVYILSKSEYENLIVNRIITVEE